MAAIFIAEFQPTADITNCIYHDNKADRWYVLENKTLSTGSELTRTVQSELTCAEIVGYLANAANRC